MQYVAVGLRCLNISTNKYLIVSIVLQQQLHVFQGCQFKEHAPVLASPRDSEVHSLFMRHQNLIRLEPSKLQFPERLTRLVSIRGKLKNCNWHENKIFLIFIFE
jgi:hypothetical protein